MVSTKVGDRLGSPCDDSPLFQYPPNLCLFGPQSKKGTNYSPSTSQFFRLMSPSLPLVFLVYKIMQKSESLQQQIQTSQQALKSEIIVNETELDSKDSVKKIIKKYQARVSEMLKLIQKQKKQNETLKGEFKQLNEQLNSVLKKVQSKNKVEDDPKNVDGRLEILKKQLENEIKKNSILKKEIEQVKYKEKYLEGYKVDDLKNMIKQKDKTIDQLNAKIKLFEKLDKQEKNGDSYKKQEELTHKIMQQNEEIVHLKKKLQEAKRNEELLEKNIKSLRDQIANTEPKNTQKPTQQKPKEKEKEKEKNDSLISRQQYDRLNEKFKQLENAKKMNDKSSKLEIDALTIKLKNYEREFGELKEQVAKKEKQGNILMFKLKEKQRKNFNTMQPIKTVRYSQEILQSSNLFQNRKQFKGLTYGHGIYRQFDDTKLLPIEKNYRIKKLTFTHFEQHILSLTTQYEILEQQMSKQVKRTSKTIESFAIPSQYANIRTVQYTFSDYEYITSFQIYTLKSIELIKIVTSKQESIEVGNVKNLPKYKQQNFEIKNHEKPIAFMGVIQNKRNGGDNKEYLISLGLEIRRKEVFIRSKTNKKQESIYRRSVVSKSHYEQKEDTE